MRVLLVKLSSLGDVVHNFPVAQDIRRAFPDARIDWCVEAPYAPLVAKHPAINLVLPVHLRALKKNWWRARHWSQVLADRARIAADAYDVIIDTQGLVKSAVVAGWAKGPRCGFDATSAREPLAAKFYARRYSVPRAQHAIARNRALAALALGISPDVDCDYGVAGNVSTQRRDIVFLHGTSRVDKEWPVEHWIALGRALNQRGHRVQLLAGNALEFARSQSIASQLDAAHARPTMPMDATAGVLANAAAVIGVDTGLAHLAVALCAPTVGLFCHTDPARTGLLAGAGGWCRNLGGIDRTPSVEEVLAQLDEAHRQKVNT